MILIHKIQIKTLVFILLDPLKAFDTFDHFHFLKIFLSLGLLTPHLSISLCCLVILSFFVSIFLTGRCKNSWAPCLVPCSSHSTFSSCMMILISVTTYSLVTPRCLMSSQPRLFQWMSHAHIQLCDRYLHLQVLEIQHVQNGTKLDLFLNLAFT